MRNTIFLNILILTTFLGCKKTATEIVPVAATNTISYNNKTYPIKNGYFIDYGIDFDAYNLYFTLTDYAIGDTTAIANSKVFITIDAYSPNDIFEAGTYKIDPYLFTENAIDEVYADIDDEELEIVSGTVVISGAKPNFAIAIDAITKDNKKLTGSFSATFIEKSQPNSINNNSNSSLKISKKTV